jgi:hypothetical protein
MQFTTLLPYSVIAIQPVGQIIEVLHLGIRTVFIGQISKHFEKPPPPGLGVLVEGKADIFSTLLYQFFRFFTSYLLLQLVGKEIGLISEPFIGDPTLAIFVVSQAIESHADPALFSWPAGGYKQKLSVVVL